MFSLLSIRSNKKMKKKMEKHFGRIEKEDEN